jgi:uncharacterized tellurite resistance protein B-like protein
MLSDIRRFFDEFMASDPSTDRDPEHAVRCAAAALLLEMANMDETLKAEEHEAVLSAVRERFALSQKEADGLIACAEAERREATDYHQFTSLINANFDAGQRAALVEQLWQVAYADRKLCKHEEYLVRKVADLLHVPHSVFISAKHRVQKDVAGQD